MVAIAPTARSTPSSSSSSTAFMLIPD
jgi:hypothetical protein